MSRASTGFGSGAKRSGGPYFCPLEIAQEMKRFRSFAFFAFTGTITQVKVEIGYAFG